MLFLEGVGDTGAGAVVGEDISTYTQCICTY